MQEYKLLIPAVRNDNRRPHTVETIQAFESVLLDAFGGFSVGQPVAGKWKDDDGNVISDLSTPIYFACEGGYLAARDLAAVAAERFAQQCVYLRSPDGRVELVDHPNPESVAYVAPPTIATPPDASELVGPDGEILAGPRRN